MKPNPDIALIYHYDLARALNGEPVDWQAIPVNIAAGREGGNLCRLAADFGKRRDLFAMPAPIVYPTLPDGRMATPRNTLAAPTVIPSVVEQPTVAPVPAGATVEPAANVDRLRNRIAAIVAAGHEQMMRNHWPDSVPTLKHAGHTDDDLKRILAAVRSVESLAGMCWHEDDGPAPHTPRRRNHF